MQGKIIRKATSTTTLACMLKMRHFQASSDKLKLFARYQSSPERGATIFLKTPVVVKVLKKKANVMWSVSCINQNRTKIFKVSDSMRFSWSFHCWHVRYKIELSKKSSESSFLKGFSLRLESIDSLIPITLILVLYQFILSPLLKRLPRSTRETNMNRTETQCNFNSYITHFIMY